jgi:predicted transcriptional regulator
MVLIENDLLEYEDGQNTYRTTSKGIRLLQIFNNMEELTPITLK